MQCPECGADVSTGEMYCGICGAEIRLDHDEVTAIVSQEIKAEKEKTTEEQMRRLLLWMGFFFITAWSLHCESKRDLVGPQYPDEAYHLPVYSTRVDLLEPIMYEDRSLDRLLNLKKSAKRKIAEHQRHAVEFDLR